MKLRIETETVWNPVTRQEDFQLMIHRKNFSVYGQGRSIEIAHMLLIRSLVDMIERDSHYD